MHFHGVSPSYIDTGDDADFAFTNQNYSVNFWAMPETASGTFMSCGIDNTNGWYINEDVNYDVHFNTCSNGSTSGLDGLNVQSGNGSWNDVCITVQGGTNVTMYWNGGLEYNGTVAAAAPSGTNALWLVQQNLGGGDGEISWMVIFGCRRYGIQPYLLMMYPSYIIMKWMALLGHNRLPPN